MVSTSKPLHDKLATSSNWTGGIVAVLSKSGHVAGTGFIVSEDGLIVTCAHVLADHIGVEPGDKVKIRFKTDGQVAEATVTAWWRDKTAEDVAFLSLLVTLPNETVVLPLVSADNSKHHPFSTFGYHQTAKIEAINGAGTIRGLVSEQSISRLQLHAHEISHGFSGSPVWDETMGGVVGVIQQGAKPDHQGRLLETSFATPSEILVSICPQITLTNAIIDISLSGQAATNALKSESLRPLSTNELFDLIETNYNESEVRLLCFRLGVKYEDLSGSTRLDKIRELVLYCERRGLLAQLGDKVIKLNVRNAKPQSNLRVSDKQGSAVREGMNAIDIDFFIEVLMQSPTIKNHDTRQALFNELPPYLQNNLNTNLPTLNTQLRDLVRTCQNYADGLSALVKAIRLLEGDTLIVQRLESLLF